MSEQQIAFELVSPEEKLVSEPVTMAVIPGTEGELGVMAGHASFVVALKSGVVSLHKESMGDEPRKIFIAGGFADVTGENCTVLAEEATNVNDLDQKQVEQSIRDLSEDLDRSEDDTEKLRIQQKLDVETARLQAVAG